ncbi:MAG: DivIVA domain-containing protein [Candidatus Improbicoccus devescovinae]|nr:MAG: DivIVA domain-containing protein [Candidatus Improbicoccus devescovinae]
MLNFNDIKNIKFSRKFFGGYDSVSVDNFLDEIYDFLSKLTQDNFLLQEKNAKLNLEIDNFRQEEINIRKAILNSQKIADAAVVDAGVKSKYILKETNDKIYRILENAKKNLSKKLLVSKKLYQYLTNFKSKLIEKYEEQLNLIHELDFESPDQIEKDLCFIEDALEKFPRKNEVCDQDLIFEDLEENINENYFNETKISAPFV